MDKLNRVPVIAVIVLLIYTGIFDVECSILVRICAFVISLYLIWQTKTKKSNELVLGNDILSNFI